MKNLLLFLSFVFLTACSLQQQREITIDQIPTTTTKIQDQTPNAGLNKKSLFPIYGITIGRTTVNEIRNMKFNCESEESGSTSCFVNRAFFWDHDNDGVIESIYLGDNVPDRWTKEFGFSFNISYDDWMNVLSTNEFTIRVLAEPSVVEYSNRRFLSAMVATYSEKDSVRIRLQFDFGNQDNEGYETSSLRSLSSITIDYWNPEYGYYEDKNDSDNEDYEI